jgi:hypothetical protein
MALCGGLNAEHGALLVPPAGDLVEEHQLLHVTRRGYPSRQVGLKYAFYKSLIQERIHGNGLPYVFGDCLLFISASDFQLIPVE